MRQDIIPTQQGEWQPFCETVGFVIRCVTRREVRYHSGYGERSRHHVRDFFLVEFDILDGWSGYMTTGFWAFDADTQRPLAEPVCTPVNFTEVLTADRISTDLSVAEAKERLQRFVQPLLR